MDSLVARLPIRVFVPAMVGAVLSGCASVPQKGGFEDVQMAVEERVELRVDWHQSEEEDAAVAAALATMLEGELRIDQAIQIALLNNRGLQATYEDLGLAQANLVQAGLLRNPLFSGGVFFPSGGGDERIDLSLAQSFLSLLYRPLRKRVAAAEFEAAKLSVTRAVLELATETCSTYYMVQADMQRQELLTRVVDATGSAYDFSRRLFEAGNVIPLDVARERALYEDARLALATAEADLVVDREHLTRLMGLWGGQVDWRMNPRLPEIPIERLDLAGMERQAIEANLNLAMQRHHIDAIATLLGITNKKALIPVLEIGVGAEREDGIWEVGPTLEFELPIFDQGQARRAAARSDLRRSQQEYWAFGVDLRSGARALHQRLETARRRAEHVQDVVLPLNNQIVSETLLQYNAMQLGVFEVLLAKRSQIAAGLQFIETRRDYWLVRTEVEQLLSGHLGSISMRPRWSVAAMSGMNMESEGGR